MQNKDALTKRAKDLAAEVKSAMDNPDLTAAQKSEFLDKAEVENNDIAAAIKNLDRAKAFRAGNDLTDGTGEPVDVKNAREAASHDAARKINDTFLAMKSAAANRQQGTFNFTLDTKAQGGPGVMGESANGTDPAAPLVNGSYFLTGAGAPSIEPQFIPGITQLKFYENVIAGLFPNLPVESPIVSWVRETLWNNNAAAVGEGATKPTSNNGLARFTEQLGKIANLVHVTDELMQDAGYFWALVQTRLAQGVTRKEEIELLAGTGYPGVNGLLNRTTGFTKGTAGLTAVTNVAIPTAGTVGAGAGSETVASMTPGRAIAGTGSAAATGVQIAEGILQMLTDIRTGTFFEPDTILMNPADFQTVRLAKDGQGQYLGGSFFGTNYGNRQNESISGSVDTGLSLWGKRTITTPVIPAGFILVGDFAEGGQVLRKGGLDVQSTNSNGTDFEQNLWTVRAEERVGLLVDRPELFELGQLTAGK